MPITSNPTNETANMVAHIVHLRKYKAAAVSAEPGWFDLQKSVEKTIHWINEAGKADCKLIAFPELCIYKHSPVYLIH